MKNKRKQLNRELTLLDKISSIYIDFEKKSIMSSPCLFMWHKIAEILAWRYLKPYFKDSENHSYTYHYKRGAFYEGHDNYHAEACDSFLDILPLPNSNIFTGLLMYYQKSEFWGFFIRYDIYSPYEMRRIIKFMEDNPGVNEEFAYMKEAFSVNEDNIFLDDDTIRLFSEIINVSSILYEPVFDINKPEDDDEYFCEEASGVCVMRNSLLPYYYRFLKSGVVKEEDISEYNDAIKKAVSILDDVFNSGSAKVFTELDANYAVFWNCDESNGFNGMGMGDGLQNIDLGVILAGKIIDMNILYLNELYHFIPDSFLTEHKDSIKCAWTRIG